VFLVGRELFSWFGELGMSGQASSVVSGGTGKLVGWHDPDENRAWIAAHKSRSLVDKRMSVEEAVKRFVDDGSFLAMGGFGHVRVSMAAVYEMVRQGKRHLTMAGKTAVHDLDVLVGAGCVDAVEVAYAFGHELRGLSPASRRAVEQGRCTVVGEISNAGYQWRFLAGMMGLPFIPSRVMLGTDTLARSSAKVIEDPFSGKPICLLPACYPDVAVIHVPRADMFGNAQIDGIMVEDFELARASRRVILSTEKIVPSSRIRAEPWKTVIPFYLVDAVIEAPFGSHPCQMPYSYFFDEQHIGEWLAGSKTDDGVEQYLEKYVFGCEGHKEYLKLVGGSKMLQRLKSIERFETEMTAPWIKKGDGAPKSGYSSTELLATAAAHVLQDGRSVFVGTGLPMIAAMLAQRTHAPNLLLIFEAGGIGPQMPVLPISVGDSRTFYHAVAASSMHDTMSMSQAGYLDYGFLGAAQIDMYGNINTTVIGPYEHPKVRLPGSGGANDVGTLCHKTIIIMRQDKERFLPKIDFLTTPGYLDGAGSREEHGLPKGSGPYRVITQLGIYGFDEESKRMTLLSLHPGVTKETAQAQSGFPLLIAKDVKQTPAPTAKEQALLRKIDPAGIVITK
jgi:acyl CoA:acetate/3-ketoacid CoA transferase alpha subunit/acyl CoA:acetate/3-ketoacid CoA transferase beta subunit